jgi:dehydrogenase/reductase SDR family protein 1
MVENKSGLIINVSSPGGLRYLFNVAYGVGKSGVDRMAADCAVELKRHNVAMISLWPGPVKTEYVEKNILQSKCPKLKKASFSYFY